MGQIVVIPTFLPRLHSWHHSDVQQFEQNDQWERDVYGKFLFGLFIDPWIQTEQAKKMCWIDEKGNIILTLTDELWFLVLCQSVELPAANISEWIVDMLPHITSTSRCSQHKWSSCLLRIQSSFQMMFLEADTYLMAYLASFWGKDFWEVLRFPILKLCIYWAHMLWWKNSAVLWNKNDIFHH